LRYGIRVLLREWLSELRGLGGYRGLVVLHDSSVGGAAASLAALLGDEAGGGLCVAPAELREQLRGACSRVMSPSAIEQLLGTENDYVVLAVPQLLRPNLVAAAAETVRGGGVVAIVAPPLREWNPGGPDSLGYYRRYLLRRLGEAQSLFWADAWGDAPYLARLPHCRAPRPEPAASYQPRTPLPRRLVEAAASLEQARALDEIAEFLRRRGRGVFVTGDRGRGKSGLLGLVAAYLVQSRMVGFVPVTAPSPGAVQSFFRVLAGALERLGVRHWLIQRGGVVLGVAGPWFHVRYNTPDQALKTVRQ
jgi:tRNA(Met) cytidine acetyltransferase